MANTFERDWRALQGGVFSLVERAKGGDVDAMLALRAVALKAGVFACLSIRNTVHNHELWYGKWLKGGAIRGLPAHRESVDNVGAWVTGHMTLDLFDDRSGVTFAREAMNIRWLGTAKAHFFAALLGFEHVPCIDRHMARMYGIKSVSDAFRPYRKQIDQIGWEHTLDQWRDFLTVPSRGGTTVSFAQTGHRVYFDSVLGRVAA